MKSRTSFVAFRCGRANSGSNKTHASTTEADARLYKKSHGKESKLSYLGHALVENRNGLIAAAMVTHADGYMPNATLRC
jgi:hypothetical protein